MEYQELVSIRDTAQSIDVDSLFDFYWYVEMGLAGEYGCFYSSLEEFGELEQRECHLCGEIADTASSGYLEECKNIKCNQIRKFFGITPFPKCYRYDSSSNNGRARGGYLRTRIVNLGYTKLSEIPEEIRFLFLFNVMMERIAYEKDN